MRDAKPVWKSKTFWVNVLAAIAAVSGAFGLDLGLTPEAQATLVPVILAVVNIILRGMTTKPVRMK